MNKSIVVKECDFNKPDVHERDSLFDDIIKDCRDIYFHLLEYRLVY